MAGEACSDCEFLGSCPIFNEFKMEGLKNFWISKYCRGPLQDECERKKLKLSGEKVPLDLMPNGKHMQSFGRL